MKRNQWDAIPLVNEMKKEVGFDYQTKLEKRIKIGRPKKKKKKRASAIIVEQINEEQNITNIEIKPFETGPNMPTINLFDDNTSGEDFADFIKNEPEQEEIQ